MTRKARIDRVWDVNVYLHVEPQSESVYPPCVHGTLRVLVDEDLAWTVSVKRDGQCFDLMLRGQPGDQTGNTLNEVLSWLFGVAA